jgi:phospholipid/cholesterol/gamma-HCH transport system substrate-binding protein
METQSNLKTKLGFFVTAGFTLLLAGIFYIGKQKHLFSPVVSLTTVFKDIGGLEVGNNVRFSGINVGVVENIQIANDTSVTVYLIVDKHVQKFIKSDSYVRISSEGIIGDKVASITQGTPNSPSIKDGDQLFSIEPLDADAIIANLKETGENVNIISGELAEVMYKVNHGNGTVARLLNDSAIAENLGDMILSLKHSSKGLDKNIKVVSGQMNNLLTKVNNGKGTLGTLIHDTTIAKNLGETMHHLKKTSESLDENMEAAKHNILLRGYFKNKKKKELEKKKLEDEKKKQETKK